MGGRTAERLRRGALVLLLMAAAAPLAAQGREADARPLVVIDAGHGGVDEGARGPGGLREKTVALAVARELAAILRADGGFEVRLTRERDVLVPLTERPRMANRWRTAGGADRPALFLSIHANAHRQSSVGGVETYFLSEAKTEDARRVAEMENAAQRFEDASTRKVDPLSFIFHDLRQNHYLRESSDWAEEIQRRLARVHPGPDRGVKQAGFLVLDGAFMPAVLVELGFISNPREERLLGDPTHQRLLARELAQAVRGHFSRASGSRAAAGS